MEIIVHETRPIKVWADVDIGIADFVEYLNQISGVRTHGSCQGTLDEGGHEPYEAEVMVSWWHDDAKKSLEQFNLKIMGEAFGYVYPRSWRKENV